MSIDFGVFYTCYTETSAVDYSIDVLKKVYKDCPVYLVSDGGADYTFLEKKHIDIVTCLEEDSRGFIPFLNPESYKSAENQAKIKKSIVVFLDRIKRAIDYCNKEYILVMEPDVLVRGKLSFPESAHLLGSRVNSGLSYELREAVRSIAGSIDVNTWGATPALFRASSFMRAYDVIMQEDNLSKLAGSDHRLANYDVLFAVMFAAAGYEETYNPEIIECFRDHTWRHSWHPLVHQFREHYPKKNDGYDGFHTRHIHGLGDRTT